MTPAKRHGGASIFNRISIVRFAIPGHVPSRIALHNRGTAALGCREAALIGVHHVHTCAAHTLADVLHQASIEPSRKLGCLRPCGRAASKERPDDSCNPNLAKSEDISRTENLS
jgi:hypothetical protein